MSEERYLPAGDEPAPEEAEAAEIRAEIDETREEMGGTLNELGDRLDPGTLMSQAKDNVRDATIGRVEETAKGVSDMVMETIRRNPIPAAMAGAGLALLWMNRSGGDGGGAARGPTYGHSAIDGERTRSMGSQATSAAAQVRDDVGDAIGQAGEQVGRTVGQVGENVGRAAGEVGSGLDRFMQASPLAMGAIAIGAGAVVGALVPETEPEREMLGDASRQVSQAVAETVEQASQQAEESLDRAEASVGSGTATN